MNEHAKVAQVKSQALPALMKKPNVIGVGTGYKTRDGRRTGDLCIVAMVTQKIPRAGLEQSALIPHEIDGISTDVVQVGFLRAHPARTDRWRPALGGVSIGHYQITAGTLGCVVRDKPSGARLILSNNHVLANSNDAQAGDPVLQPGTADGGRAPGDTFATLERFCPLAFSDAPATCGLARFYADLGNALARLLGSKHRVQVSFSDPQAVNQVDAALARPVNEADLLDEILEIGAPTGTIEAALGMAVRKSGRTTGLTTGLIVVIDATLEISYGERKATFEGQLVSTPMSQPGDSGSLLVAADSLAAVGLLFAGSDQATIYNPIKPVLDCLNVSIG
jgi:hypothetical protein